MQRTAYYYDFLEYYKRAAHLQASTLSMRAGGPSLGPCGDALQDNVHVYNNVLRRYAGFSNVLEDIHGRRLDRYRLEGKNGAFGNDYYMRYLELVHRITGSGASFESDHGYRNTCVPTLYTYYDQVNEASTWFSYYGMNDKKQRPTIFTSIGNQICAFNKPTGGFTSGGWMYLALMAPKLATNYWNMVVEYYDRYGDPINQRTATDWCLQWQKNHGMKQYHFVLTAFVMDGAEYTPRFVDQNSLTYYGKNAYEALDLMYVNEEGFKKSFFYDNAVIDLCNTLGAYPYDMEDVCCDAIRYWENYVPKRDYDHIDRKELFNNSSITNHPKGRQAWKRGTDQWVW